MKLRILGSAGAEFPGFHPPGFLVDDILMLDAGTCTSVLEEEEQWAIRHIFVTHTHLDHFRSIPALADNIIIKNLRHMVDIYSTDEITDAMQDHIFNWLIWPDFSVLPTPDNPVIRFNRIETLQMISLPGLTPESPGYNITAIPVHHNVPAVGYCLESKGKRLVYTGDTGPTDQIWQYASGADVLIVEVSFPNSQESMALITQHLCCSLLEQELAKMDHLPKRILITHPKPQHYEQIKQELAALGISQIELLRDGTVYEI